MSAVRADDLFTEPDQIGLVRSRRRLNMVLLDNVRRAALEDHDDVEVAVALARLVHDDLERFGTGGGEETTVEEMREALRVLQILVERIGIPNLTIPFRDFSGFKTWWNQNDAYGSWQARRDLLHNLFEPLHEHLARIEQQSIASTLVSPATSHVRTGWPGVDIEIAELRRHFQAARTPQDYRNIGLDCVAVTEALSRTVYDPAKHLRSGEEAPPVANTKLRLERFIEDAAPGPDLAALRKLARAAIEFAQAVKHRGTPTRRDAGIAADAVIQLANLLRRLDEPS